MALTLTPATGPVLDHILRDTYPIWGGGLSFEAYRSFQTGQKRTSWGGAHIERVALFDGSRMLASAKRYDLSARVDGRIRRVLGLGAVFTTRELRGRGAASALIVHLVDAANTEGYEFAMLFSDIVGFTTLTETADPEKLVAQLNEYLTRTDPQSSTDV